MSSADDDDTRLPRHPILIESVQRQVRQAGVLRDPDAVFTPGPATMPQFEILNLTPNAVGDKRRQPETVGVGETESDGVRHPLRVQVVQRFAACPGAVGTNQQSCAGSVSGGEQ
ncbi:hypothetical protein BO226_15810 [Rhodococcus sp. 2G]|nr:hypothetical protein BO226_15810 [Rhodococcus sp. 2G]